MLIASIIHKRRYAYTVPEDDYDCCDLELEYLAGDVPARYPVPAIPLIVDISEYAVTISEDGYVFPEIDDEVLSKIVCGWSRDDFDWEATYA